MEIWVQYTLDMTKKEGGTLTLGGWVTDEIAYKVVPEKKFNHAGYMRSQIVGDPVEQLREAIMRSSWKANQFMTGCKHVELLYQDDFTLVFAVSEKKSNYDPRKGKWGDEDMLTLISLAVFVRTIPVHVAKDFKEFLHEIISPTIVSDTAAESSPAAVPADNPQSSPKEPGAAEETEPPGWDTAT